MSSTRDIDLSFGPTPDAESIVNSLLTEFTGYLKRNNALGDGYSTVSVQSEVTPVTDATLQVHPVILYQCGAPVLDPNTRAWFFRVPLTLTVLVDDNPDVAWHLASLLDETVRLWPVHAPTRFGQVTSIVSDSGFARQQTGNIATAHAVTQYGADKTIMVCPPPSSG